VYHDEEQFYPTPLPLIQKMVAPFILETKRGEHIRRSLPVKYSLLEPSAGEGHILDYLKRTGVNVEHMLVYEVNPERSRILESKGYTVIGTDFLAESDPFLIDVIVANPPFNNGVQHVLKMWDILAPGGKMVVLLNADAVKNPSTHDRKKLVDLIDIFGNCEYVQGGFSEAIRKTNIETVIIWLYKPDKEETSSGVNWQEMDSRDDFTVADQDEVSGGLVIRADSITLLVERYNRAIEALKQLKHYEEVLRTTTGEIVQFKNDGYESVNAEIKNIKVRFWEAVFQATRFGQQTTHEYRQKFLQEVQQHGMRTAFTVKNIYLVLEAFMFNKDRLMQEAAYAVAKTMMSIDGKNGETWKNNKSWKIAMKNIFPYAVSVDTWGISWSYSYQNWSKSAIEDLEKILCWLRGVDPTTIYSVGDALKDHSDKCRKNQSTYSDVFESEFFNCRVYKKGTIHLMWKDKDLNGEFNRAVSDGSILGDGS